MSETIEVLFKALSPRATQPCQANPGDAGHDLFVSRDVVIGPRSTSDVNTDIAVALPEGWFAQIVSRSSTLPRHGLMVQPAVIDAGYRGELYFQVHNPSDFSVTVESGSRLCQILILPVPQVTWRKVPSLSRSKRGSSGFGSTGV